MDREGNEEKSGDRESIISSPRHLRAGFAVEFASEKAFMANDEYKKAFDSLLGTYVSLDESAGTIVRQLKKIANADGRSKLIRELRNLENKRLELLDQIDSLGKST
jgi:hypothetical protein